MKKIHLTCGDIYLLSYENCDIVGHALTDLDRAMLEDGIIKNPNATTLENYFVRPFVKDSNQRVLNEFIIDTKMNILEKWRWDDESVDEIVQINSFEHFWHNSEIPFLISQARRVLKVGGVWKFDFPDVKEIVNQYHDTDPDFCMKLIYGSRKNQYSCHEFGYTKKSIKDYFPSEIWSLEFKDVVKHDYPSTGVFATKISS